MPIAIQAVENFSSEDPNFPANNLLQAKDVRKWKCREPGEKSAYVVLRLEKPININGIDIGNEHSAFIEVLVARSGPSQPEFREIMLTSSFMSPIESRNSENPNRVRCFSMSALIESVAKDRWDLVKIICTQPFNSRVQYGVSFVKLHSPSAEIKPSNNKSLVPEKFQKKIDEETVKKEPPKVLQLGRFTIREESPDSDGASSSTTLFARWKQSRNGLEPSAQSPVINKTSGASISTAAAIRNASTPAALKQKQSTPVAKRAIINTPKAKPRLFDDDDDAEIIKPKNRNSDSILYNKEDDESNEKLEKKLAQDRMRLQREKDARKDKDRKDRSLTEKKEKSHDTSSSKFKNFLFDDSPPSTPNKEAQSEKALKDKHVVSNKSEQRTSRELNSTKKTSNLEATPEIRKRHSSANTSSSERNPQGSSVSKKQRLQLSSDDESSKQKKPAQYKPFNKLLENVILVISGIQNPDRANLRTQALALGAKYKSDWDSSCTHLICAFKNTPKYNQVRGHGKIVKKEWIERCHALRKRISWRKFALDSKEAEKSDSEEEILDIDSKPSNGVQSTKPSPKQSSQKETDEEALAHYDLDDVIMIEGDKPETYEVSGSDTEEEIERIRQNQKHDPSKPQDNYGMYDKSTEEEPDSSGKAENGDSKQFFQGKTFYLDDAVGAVDLIKLEQYVSLYKGFVTKTIAEADYVVTRNKKPMPDSFKGELIKPLWIYECHDMECLIPTQRYKP
ncbi:DNA repair protein XRCC1 [Uranotaenia lowii]|uniref:DNA repair protein XRCC1 n=1 Tax=Uranotaenia lowii TaxID=190385 RepID=UPI00247A464F|nr:DNA repair protein XRCC1 [Uranotaenia lowii]